MTWLIKGDARHIPLEEKSIQCVITSPPYWGLRDYGYEGQLGLEKTLEEFLDNMAAVFREVWRVLRDDGTCWVNMGDSYSGSWKGGGYSFNKGNSHCTYLGAGIIPGGLKAKDLIGMPWRLAFALQADGWYLRSDIIWHKPNPMPESCKDRPTKSHEHLFLLTKKPKYYYDADAVRENSVDPTNQRPKGRNFKGKYEGKQSFRHPSTSHNLRDVWIIPTHPYPGSHFATFPEKLVEPCILAGTSQKGACPQCGAPWRREIDIEYIPAGGKGQNEKTLSDEAKNQIQAPGPPSFKHGRANKNVTTIGWQPSCSCKAGEPVSCIVLDPFAGSGTVGAVAEKWNRKVVLLDLGYQELARKRLNGIQKRLIL